MRSNKYIFFILFVVVTAFIPKLQQIYDELSIAVNAGNAATISSYFNDNVELAILDKENVYSKAQAEQILKDFFIKFKPKSYKIIHQGKSTEGSKYAIGNYLAENGTVFRTYFYIKQNKDKYNIQEIRFEVEEKK